MGPYDAKPFYIIASSASPTASPIVSFEYFVDTDPGVGTATTFSVTPSTDVTLTNQDLSIGTLAAGTHKFVMRAKMQDNTWGPYEVRSFNICNQDIPVPAAATAITSNSFATNWSTTTGAVSYRLDVSKDNFATFVTGYNAKTINAPIISDAVTGLTPATTYQYRVRAFGTADNCLSDYSSTIVATTLLTLPSAQPTSLNIAPGTTSLAFSFTAASGSPTGYLIVRKQGSATSFVPAHNTVYTAGQSVDGTIIYVGPLTSFNDIGLTTSNTYHYTIFSYNQSGIFYSYLATTPLSGSKSTLAPEPSTQPTGISFTGITTTGLNLSFTAATGTPQGYLVLRRTGAAPSFAPVDGTSYTVGNTYGDSYVVSTSASVSIPESGLSPNVVYHYAVYAYNGSGVTTNYITTSPLTGSQATMPSEPAVPTGILFSNVNATTLTVSFTASAPPAAGYVILRQANAIPASVSDGVPYTTGQSVGASLVVYNGTSTSFGDTGLLPSTNYYYSVYAFNGSGILTNYSNPLTGNRTTFADQPAAQPTALTFSAMTTTGFHLSFTPPAGTPTGYVVLRSSAAFPSYVPVDGTTYTLNQAPGASAAEGVIAYVGSSAAFDETLLTANTVYYYSVYAFNGSGTTINYLSTGPLSGSQRTLPNEPASATTVVFSNITETGMKVTWSAPSPVPDGYIVLRRPGSDPSDVTDGPLYIVGQNLSGSTVVYSGTATTFTDSGLTSNTVYHYGVYAFNGSGTSVNYAPSLTGNHSTLAAEPSTQPTSIVFSSVTTSSMSVSFTTAAGSPSGYLVLRAAAAAPSFTPVDGSVYALNTNVGNGTVASVGATNLVNESSLFPNTNYYYAIYAYNGAGESINYRLTTPLSGNQLTLNAPPVNQPTDLVFTAISETSLSVGFTAAIGAPSGYVVIRRPSVASTFVPLSNVLYTAGQVVGDGIVAYSGTSTSFNNSGLVALTDYYYTVFGYNQSGAQFAYLTTAPLTGHKSTVAAEPTAQPATMNFSLITTNSLRVSWPAPSPSPQLYITVRRVGAAPVFRPTDGTTYSIGNTVSPGETVVAFGAGTSFDDGGLTAGETCHYIIFSANGSGPTTNYLTTVASGNASSVVTLPAKPQLQAASNVQQTSFSISWLAVTGASSYRVDVSKDNFVTTIAGYNNLTVNGLSVSTSGLEMGVFYKYRVRAVNASGVSADSDVNEQITVPATPVLASPTAASQSGFTLEWTATPGAYNYLFDLSQDNFAHFVAGFENLPVNLNKIILTGLAAGNIYQYRIRSSNNGGTSPYSVPGEQLLLPATPSGVSTTGVTTMSLTLQWGTVLNASGYLIDVSTVSTFAAIVTGYDGLFVADPQAIVSGLATGTQYFARIRSVNAAGNSPASAPIAQFTVPSAPVLLQASGVGQTAFTAKWTAVTGASHYLLDVSIDDFASFVQGYNSKIVTATEIAVTGLPPGSICKYRLRAVNGGGTSDNSNTREQLLKPGDPVGVDTSIPTQTSFKAQWNPITGATTYVLEVSASADFHPLLPGFPVNVQAPVTEYTVSGLQAGTLYRFRVTAVNLSGSSNASIPVEKTTQDLGGNGQLAFSAPAYINRISTTPVAITIEVTSGKAPFTAIFSWRKITADVYETVDAVQTTTSTFQATVSPSMTDELGTEFFFTVLDANGQPKESPTTYFIYNAVASTGQKIPFTKSGGTVESYELFSIPYQVEDNQVGSIFDELGDADRSRWRLVRYQNGRNVDLSGLNKIEPGNGYWFNRREAIDVTFTGATVVKKNQSEPFRLILASGWNQVGNPFPFDVDWDDVKEGATNPSAIGNLKIFNPVELHLNDESNNLRTWSGGFVHNDSEQPVDIVMPVTLRADAGGRKNRSDITDLPADIGHAEWYLPLNIKQGDWANHSTGLGMHPDASSSKDPFDEIVPPRFVNHLEFYTRHDEFFSPRFARDVVPTAPSHTWSFEFESNGEGEAEIQWDPASLGLSDARLYLFHSGENALIDMKSADRYRFDGKSKSSLRIFFGADERSVSLDISGMGPAYPNPFTEVTNIPFFIADQANVSITVCDLTGRIVSTLAEGIYGEGIHTLAWDGHDAAGFPLAAGLYLCRMQVDQQMYIRRIIKR